MSAIPKAKGGTAYRQNTAAELAASKTLPALSALEMPRGMQTQYVKRNPLNPNTAETPNRSETSRPTVLLGYR